MYTAINRKVQVVALFQNGKIIPKIFKWQSRDYKVHEISLYYTERDGKSINHYFGILTSDGNVFKLSFNNLSLIWILQEVWSE